jgi:hypothetical protein
LRCLASLVAVLATLALLAGNEDWLTRCSRIVCYECLSNVHV